MMNKSKIDWCDFTWNPVTGCLRGCRYCYARKQANRFCGDVRLNLSTKQILETITPTGKVYMLDQPFKNNQGKVLPFPAGFQPTFHRYRLPMPERKKKPASIFVCSMGDLFAPVIPTGWILDVLDACTAAPWHRYLFLTKYPERYQQLEEMALLPHGDGFWYGTTVTCTADLERLGCLPPTVRRFVSVEPILEDVHPLPESAVDWLLVGAETGNQSDKHAPQKAWLKALVADARRDGIPVLLKDSQELRAVWKGHLIQEFPDGLHPMTTFIPHCKTCKYATSVKQGKRGISYTCTLVQPPRHIPGRYTRTSPSWCPRREDDQHK